MTSNAPQGPGWWHASDGNWYAPQQQPGHAPPPLPEYPAPAGQTSGNAPAASAVGAAKLPVAAWLLYAGCAIFLVTSFLPARAPSANWRPPSISVGHLFWNLVMTAVCAGLVWATFTRPRPRLWSLITLTVVTAVEVLGAIVIYAGLKSISASPGLGALLSAPAIGLLVVGIIMAWISRSRAQR
jgi:hypothetical protein